MCIQFKTSYLNYLPSDISSADFNLINVSLNYSLSGVLLTDREWGSDL